MVIPAGVGAALVVIETELGLQFRVGLLGAPSLLDGARDLLLAHAPRQRRERELRRLFFVVWPLDHEPHRIAIGRGRAVVVSDDDAAEAELREEDRVSHPAK